MSKKSKSNGKGLEALKVLVAPELEPEVVETVCIELQSLPEYAAFDQAIALQAEAEVLKAEEVRLNNSRGNEALHLEEVKREAAVLQRQVLNHQASAKSSILNDPSVTENRSLFEQMFGKWLDNAVQSALSKSPAHIQLKDTLRKLIAEANELQKSLDTSKARVEELRLSYMAKEQEAQLLLGSINL